jgi:hypothetical protein
MDLDQYLENGVFNNPNAKSYSFCIFDPATKAYLGVGETGTSEVYHFLENATFTPLPEHDPLSQIPIWDEVSKDWYLIATECHLYDEDGYYIETKQNPLLNTAQDSIPPNTEIPVPEGMENPCFDITNQVWENIPIED